MAKETVKVDNNLEDVKLESSEKLKKKEKIKKEKVAKKKTKREKSNNYLKQVSSEMKLVTWPSKKDMFKYSMATIAMIIVLAGFFIGITALFDLLYNLVQGWLG